MDSCGQQRCRVELPESHFNMVRPGLLLYGLSPMDEPSPLTAVMTLLSRIVALRWIPTGGSIGYGRTFTAQRDTLIATLPIGYSDGLRRRLSNHLKIELRGQMVPVVGSISMDMCMADVTELADEVKLYDIATFIGPRTSAWDWARNPELHRVGNLLPPRLARPPRLQAPRHHRRRLLPVNLLERVKKSKPTAKIPC